METAPGSGAPTLRWACGRARPSLGRSAAVACAAAVAACAACDHAVRRGLPSATARASSCTNGSMASTIVLSPTRACPAALTARSRRCASSKLGRRARSCCSRGECRRRRSRPAPPRRSGRPKETRTHCPWPRRARSLGPRAPRRPDSDPSLHRSPSPPSSTGRDGGGSHRPRPARSGSCSPPRDLRRARRQSGRDH